jgi:hypothetical protein
MSQTLPNKSSVVSAPGLDYIVTSISSDQELVERVGLAEMLVLTKLSGANFNAFAQAIDQSLDGLLTATADGWHAQPGSYRLLHLPALGKQLGGLQYILLVGLGNTSQFQRRNLCAFTGMALSAAARMRVKRLLFLESPHRCTEQQLTLKGSAAIMRCRTDVLRGNGMLRELEALEFAATPQAKPFLLAGLNVTTLRCHTCSSPEL